MMLLTRGVLLAASFLLVYVSLSDIFFRIIPNKASVFIFFCSVFLACTRSDGTAEFVILPITFFILYLLWVANMIGGGDVKLIVAVTPAIPQHKIFLFFLAVVGCGGVLAAFVWLLSKKKTKLSVLTKCYAPNDMVTVPYGVAIVAATLLEVNKYGVYI